MDVDIYTHSDQNNTSVVNKASGYLLSFFLLTARNKCTCVSGKHRKDEYSFLEKISLNLPL